MGITLLICTLKLSGGTWQTRFFMQSDCTGKKVWLYMLAFHSFHLSDTGFKPSVVDYSCLEIGYRKSKSSLY